jgi:hypothetical protein
MALTTWTRAWQAGHVSLSELEATTVNVLAAHRLMTTAQLHALLRPSRSLRWMQLVLQRLEAAGLTGRKTTRDRASAWFVTPAGHDLATGAVPARRYQITPEKAGGPLQQHTLAANEVGVAFAAHARAAGHQFGPLDWDNEIAHRIADGGDRFANLLVSDLRIRCWIHDPAGDYGLVRLVELDRATTSIIDLHHKVRGYGQLLLYTPAARTSGRPTAAASAPAWRQRYRSFPKLLVVFAGRDEPALERRMDALADLVRADPALGGHLDQLGVYLTTLRRLVDHGPFQPIFERPDRAPEDRVDVLGRPTQP